MPEDVPTEQVPELAADAETETDKFAHDPFAVAILTDIHKAQLGNGLRHHDHMRYRQYCTRKLRRLYVALNFKHGTRGRYKKVAFPEQFNDKRYLRILAVLADRAWAYGMQLKQDNAAAAAPNNKVRRFSIQRFMKATSWASKLEAACKVHGDERTQMEAEAYRNYIEGFLLIEKEKWSEALKTILRCRKLVQYLGVASGEEESKMLKSKAQELIPSLRECKYHLDLRYDEDCPDDIGDEQPAETSHKQKVDELSGLIYRGQSIVIADEEVKTKLFKCIRLHADIKLSDEDLLQKDLVIERYGEVAVEFNDSMKDIHAAMIKGGADGQTDEWKKLESYARQRSLAVNMERNAILLRNHMTKLDGLESVTAAETRKTCKPEEGMRFCDMLKQDLAILIEMPDASKVLNECLDAYVALGANCRCLLLAVCYMSLGKLVESAALLDMLHTRMEDVQFTDSADETFARLHSYLEGIQKGLLNWVLKWKTRGLVLLCRYGQEAAHKDEKTAKSAKKASNESLNLLTYRELNCKPLLRDLAFQYIDGPDFEDLNEQSDSPNKSDEGDEQKGLLGKVAGAAGGIRNRLGGLFGRK